MRGRTTVGVALVALVVSASAPGVFLWSQLDALGQRGEATAAHVARLLMQDARPHPTLWRYDTYKLGERLRSYREQDDVALVEVADARQRWVDTGAPRPGLQDSQGLLWRHAPISVGGAEVGRVWVGVDLSASRLQALALVALFGLVGFAVVVLLGRIQADAASRERLVLELSQRALEMQESERRAIARDLHDVTAQALTALRIDLELLRRLPPGRGRSEVLDRAVSTTDGAVEDVRRALSALRAAVLDDVGLEEALRRLCLACSEQHELEVSCELSLPGPVGPSVELAVYRICQEALTNVARHAGATRAEVRVAVENESLVVRVEDDGRGLDNPSEGTGLRGVRERVTLLGGRLDVSASAAGGGLVRATLPWSSFDGATRGQDAG